MLVLPSPTSLQGLGKAQGVRRSRPLAARRPCQRQSPAPDRAHHRLQAQRALVVTRTRQAAAQQQREPPATTIPAHARARGAAYVSWMWLRGRGRRLGRRPHDCAATAALSRLLGPYLIRVASPVLSDSCTPVNARHIHVMCATKDAQRARERAACVEGWGSYGRRSGRGVRTTFAMSSLSRPKHQIVIFSSRAPARAREDEDNVSACGPTFDASPQPRRLRNALVRPSPHTLSWSQPQLSFRSFVPPHRNFRENFAKVSRSHTHYR